MSTRNKSTTMVQEAWIELHNRWKAEEADGFFQQYVSKLVETANAHDSACTKISDLATELDKELKAIEQGLQN